jgi:collagen triple helix repeat protein
MSPCSGWTPRSSGPVSAGPPLARVVARKGKPFIRASARWQLRTLNLEAIAESVPDSSVFSQAAGPAADGYFMAFRIAVGKSLKSRIMLAAVGAAVVGLALALGATDGGGHPRTVLTATSHELAGPAGPVGQIGPTGRTGATGLIGATGLLGPTGAKGSAGPRGLSGPTGATGPAGPRGVAGATGPRGATGATGATGPRGATGAEGAAGPVGPPGSTDFANVYNTSPEAVATNADVQFSDNSSLSGMTFSGGGTGVTVTKAGTYLIYVDVDTVEERGQFSVAVNGVATSSVFGGENGPFPTGVVTGQAILTLASGDVVTIKNTSDYDQFIQTYAPGSGIPQNASLVIEQLG